MNANSSVRCKTICFHLNDTHVRCMIFLALNSRICNSLVKNYDFILVHFDFIEVCSHSCIRAPASVSKQLDAAFRAASRVQSPYFDLDKGFKNDLCNFKRGL